MTIELISKNDCVSNGNRKGKGKEKVDCSIKNYKGKMLKKITNRDRKRCYNCGHDNGMWYEYFTKGRREYHFLCESCIDTIEGKK